MSGQESASGDALRPIMTPSLISAAAASSAAESMNVHHRVI